MLIGREPFVDSCPRLPAIDMKTTRAHFQDCDTHPKVIQLWKSQQATAKTFAVACSRLVFLQAVLIFMPVAGVEDFPGQLPEAKEIFFRPRWQCLLAVFRGARDFKTDIECLFQATDLCLRFICPADLANLRTVEFVLSPFGPSDSSSARIYALFLS